MMRPSQPLFSDTPPEIEERVLDIYRRIPAWRKVELVDDAVRTGRLLALAGLRSRDPDEPLVRLRRRLLGIVLGEDLADEVYGPLANG